MKAKAPYNFVPVNDNVYFPDWANQVSHDMPFSDGESGVIEYEIEAVSPLIVGGVHNREEANSKDNPLEFPKNAAGEVFIPGTSVKGMVRNVMEIMSFGKLKPLNSAKNHIREIKLDSNAYDLIREQNKIRCGWLKENAKGEWIIMDCDKPGRIGHDKIDRALQTNFVDCYKQNGAVKLSKDENRTAESKYNRFNLRGKKYNFIEIKSGPIHNFYEIDEASGRIGQIVLTGQPSERKKTLKGKWTGKFYEFVFFEPLKKVFVTVPKDKKADFLNAYHAFDKANESPDWRMWKQETKGENGVPVFFRLDNKNHLLDFGLSFLYKMPYKYAPKDMLSDDHRKEKPDLTELIFGKVLSEKKQESNYAELKGRAQFTHLKPLVEIEHQICEVLLATPRSSFYPFYLKQNSQKGIVAKYDDYSTKNGRLAGWKRYPVANPLTTQSQGPINMKTWIEPLGVGTKFAGEVYFHNLRRIELGALLSALTFHQNSDCLHQLGMGKPLGFGKVRVNIKQVITNKDSKDFILGSDQINDVLAEFEHEMDNELSTKWVNEGQIRELLTLAYEGNLERQDLAVQLNYMSEPKSFAKVKSDNEVLKRFSTLGGVRIKSPKSLQSESFLEKLNLEKQRNEEEKRRIEEQKKEELLLNQMAKQKEEALRLKNKRREDAENEMSRAADLIISKNKIKDLTSYIEGNYARLIGIPVNPIHERALKESILKMTEIKRELKHMKDFDSKNGFWQKSIIKWVGPEKAQQWFNEIIKK